LVLAIAEGTRVLYGLIDSRKKCAGPAPPERASACAPIANKQNTHSRTVRAKKHYDFRGVGPCFEALARSGFKFCDLYIDCLGFVDGTAWIVGVKAARTGPAMESLLLWVDFFMEDEGAAIGIPDLPLSCKDWSTVRRGTSDIVWFGGRGALAMTLTRRDALKIKRRTRSRELL